MPRKLLHSGCGIATAYSGTFLHSPYNVYFTNMMLWLQYLFLVFVRAGRLEPVQLTAGAQVPPKRGLEVLQQVLRPAGGGPQQSHRAGKRPGK